MCTKDFVSSSGCELDGTVHNVSYSTLDGCQTCTCKVSIWHSPISTHKASVNPFLSPLCPTFGHRVVSGSALPCPALQWTAHRRRLYLETAASDAEVSTLKQILKCIFVHYLNINRSSELMQCIDFQHMVWKKLTTLVQARLSTFWAGWIWGIIFDRLSPVALFTLL